jgi:putative DNA primase/helicase
MAAPNWLWPGWLCSGKLHLIAGESGGGKTTVATKLAAIVSTGSTFPDGTPSSAGDVMIWSGEDSVEDTLVPRLAAAGADLDRCMFPDAVGVGDKQRPFDPLLDVPLLEAFLHEAPRQVKLLVVDPIVSFSPGSSNQAVRNSLTPLVQLAEGHGVAIIGITHVSKGSRNRSPKERILGAQSLVALARVVMMTDRRPTGEPVLMRVKSNLGPEGGAYPYRIEGVTLDRDRKLYSSAASFGQYLDLSIDEVLGTVGDEREPSGSTLDSAANFLLELLRAGMRESKEIKLLADEAGYSNATLRRAKTLAEVVSVKRGDQWWWKLGDDQDAQEDEHLDVEHLDRGRLLTFPKNPTIQ